MFSFVVLLSASRPMFTCKSTHFVSDDVISVHVSVRNVLVFCLLF